ncbi:GAF domain-containing protein [Gymnodinialimonas ceratoperidinii]|uniref:GAF domain-containing protein n=1 Tax=Gymnodinialimonas ceratoperidinii TaxID=2856823 RepID=A0A8F6YB41_9RHOB|nr:GAF domain-containing protein [Gymnodinialimonas ceratoperidinii]QXT40584.1 GAF domain-containing protein [Gymnodinialimonas ceratoperidinii]
MTQAETARAEFDTALDAATTEDQVFDALYALSDALVPVRLWTVMTVDMEAGVARRAYTNMPEAYPASGTKPITRNAWFEIVHDRHECFVANTLDEIAQVFPDFELIGSLGCGSVLNLPVIDGGELVATVNLLDAEGHFTTDRVARCREVLTEPALRAMRKARALQQG